MRIILGVMAALAAWAATTAAHAQTAKPDPYQCALAYSAAGKERARAQTMGPTGNSLVSLLGAVPQAHEFDRRTHAMDPAIKASGSGRSSLGAAMESRAVAGEIAAESTLILLDVTQGRTDILAKARRVFGQARACDEAYGFTPVIGPAPTAEAITAHYKDRSDKARQGRTDRFAALDDLQCAARFGLVGAAMPNDLAFRQVMSRKMDVAGAKAMAATPGLTRERLLEQVTRAATERGGALKTPEAFKGLLEEVNACEQRYGLPLTQMTPTAK